VWEKLVMLFRRSVSFVRSEGPKFLKLLKEKLVLLFHRFVLIARNWGGKFGKVGRIRENDSRGELRPKDDNLGELRPKFKWPYVVNSSVAIYRPPVSGTWIWHHQHARWHHHYYRSRR
jgi:hypothetical protein